MFIQKFNELIRQDCNNVQRYLASFPSSYLFYCKEAIYQKTGISLSLREVKRLLNEEFGQARLDTHKD